MIPIASLDFNQKTKQNIITEPQVPRRRTTTTEREIYIIKYRNIYKFHTSNRMKIRQDEEELMGFIKKVSLNRVSVRQTNCKH